MIFVVCFCTFIVLGPPGAPRNLHVTDITTSAISISWEPPVTSEGKGDVTQYNIEMKEEQEAEYSAVAKMSNRITSYTCLLYTSPSPRDS